MNGRSAATSQLMSRKLCFRLGFQGVLPFLAAVAGLESLLVAWCCLTALLLASLEAAIFVRARCVGECRALPFAFRLLVALTLDVCVGLLVVASRAEGAAAHAAGTRSSASPGLGSTAKLSVVLPCANESSFVRRTVESIYSATPLDLLQEIVIIDDASNPPVELDLHSEFLAAHRVRVIRHNSAQGLIRSKKDGGDAALGDVIAFLDCHVRPMENWTVPILANLRENPRRVVVPSITALDPDTWEEISPYGGGTKMCLTWNADFVWCNSYPGPYVPVMSGGLLAMTRFWWEATGGYDEHMLSWGGENLDQSLRTWLCGGEIMVAEGSRVAHMWRDPAKPKTMLHYAIPTDHVRRNRLRASKAWLGEWAQKVESFPEFEDFAEGGRLEVGSLANIEQFRERLACKDFSWYLRRFQDLYESTGRLPATVFHLRERSTGLCLQYQGAAGGASRRQASFALAPCSSRAEFQRIHGANQRHTGECCSGLKAWDWDACLAVYELGGGANADMCEGAGDVPAQRMSLAEGQLLWEDGPACVMPVALGSAAAPAMHEEVKAPKAALVAGSCRAVVEDLDAEAGTFMLVLQGRNGQRSCLTAPVADSIEAAHEQSLRFQPCGEVPAEYTTFRRMRDHGDGRHQVAGAVGLCMDATSGAGLVTYVCHGPDMSDPNQLFRVTSGSAMHWNASMLGSLVDWCVDAEESVGDPVGSALCLTADEAAGATSEGLAVEADAGAARRQVPKRGQGFQRSDVRADGSFELRETGHHEGDGARCLLPGARGGETLLLASPCDQSDQQRWTFQVVRGQRGRLVALESGLCLDAGADHSLTLFECIQEESFLGQHFQLHSNGWIEAPKHWADNGRMRAPARCVDTHPLKAPSLMAKECNEARHAGVLWERIWEEVPIETRLFKNAMGEIRSPAH